LPKHADVEHVAWSEQVRFGSLNIERRTLRSARCGRLLLRFLPGRLLRFLRTAETREHAGESDGNDQTELNSHSITSMVKFFFAVDVFYVD
jgi:hypothetical protein